MLSLEDCSWVVMAGIAEERGFGTGIGEGGGDKRCAVV